MYLIALSSRVNLLVGQGRVTTIPNYGGDALFLLEHDAFLELENVLHCCLHKLVERHHHFKEKKE